MPPPYNQNGIQVIALCSTFTMLASISVFARLYTRIFILQNVGKDDYVIALSWIFAVVCGIIMIMQTVNGLGHHLSELTTEEFSTVLKYFYWSIPFYYASLSLTKFTIVFQTLRFVAPSQKRSRLACWIMIGVILCYLVYTIITAFAICIPAAYFWDKTLDGYCLNFLALWFVNAALNIVTDIAILVIPLRVIIAIQLPKKQKVWLVLVFALGGIVCVSSILRLQSLYVVSVSGDPTYDNTAAAYWSNIEMNLAIICSCLPTLRPLLSRFSSTFRGSSYAARSYGPRSRNTRQQSLGPPGIMASERMSVRESRVAAARPVGTDSEVPLKNIVVTTEIKQDFAGAHDQEESISSGASTSGVQDKDFV